MRIILLYLLLISSQGPILAQSEWTLSKEQDGIKVFTRQVEGTRIREFKAECTLHATLSTIVAVLTDADNLAEWVFNARQSRLLERVNQGENYYYIEMNVPFPFQNRDLVQHLTISLEKDGSLVATMSNYPQYIPEEKSLVRMQKAEGKWIFEPVGGGKLKVTFQYISDPGGNIPAFLVNAFIVKSPFETLKNLKEQVSKPEYKQVQFDWLTGN